MLRRFVVGSLGVGAMTWGLHKGFETPVVMAAEAAPRAGDFAPNLPLYSTDDVFKNRKRGGGGRVWVTYRHGVYDVTDFIENHPGGDKILLAAGGGLEAFWKMYQQHLTPEVFKILESHRIGNLKDAKVQDISISEGDMWKNEPTRHPALIVHTQKPFNAEPPSEVLFSPTTPNELFFVRNHIAVPVVDPGTYKLEITGEGVRNVSLSLEDLKTMFVKQTITSVVQCSGNRRTEVGKVGTVRGLPWKTGAIGNAEWTGVRLRDVLLYSGFNPQNSSVQHIRFQGLDKDMSGPFEVSIPIDKAMNEYGDVLLAFEMNGEPIPRDHGYPIRAIVPGTVGARQCKWLSRIIMSPTESQGIYQQKDYKSFAPGTSMDGSTVPSIQELPVQSAITDPPEGVSIAKDSGSVPIKGYAWSGGGRAINRVDITTDLGKSWSQATLRPPANQNPGRTWGWTLFEADIKVPEEKKPGDTFTVCSRAVDSGNNVQPERADPTYHIRGMLCNRWHCNDIKIE